MNSAFKVIVFAGLLLSVGACGSSGNGLPDADITDAAADIVVLDSGLDSVSDVAVDVSHFDVVQDHFGDAAGDSDLTDVDDTGFDDGDSIGRDAVDSGVSDADASADAAEVTEPGTFGWPCSSDDDCLAGPCVITDDGRICSTTCTSACPDGFTCESWVSGGLDPILVCLPEFLNMCRPCRVDVDCTRGLSATAGMACRAFSPEEGGFCTPPCVNHCPQGFECTVADEGGSWCLPVSGTCGCTWLSSSEAATTPCSVGAGGISTRCSGTRACSQDGLSECSARAPDGEKCNLIDDDCDGQTDEAGAVECTTFYFDLDDDGQGIESVARCLCSASGAYRATEIGDCDDSNPQINKDAVEECNGVDDDCDTVVDEPGSTRCNMYYADNDGDGVGSDVESICLCIPSDDYPLVRGGDCDDSSAFVGPDIAEACNGIDDDCDELTDSEGSDGCTWYYQDNDSDTYGNPAASKCLCAPSGKFTAAKVGDCNDSSALINPTIVEACNGVDDNCDGVRDVEDSAGCTRYYADVDMDSVGVAWDSKCLCRKTDFYTATVTGDCDDSSATVKPGLQEVCGNLIDEDCDGLLNEIGASGCSSFFADRDQDGVGDSNDMVCLCDVLFPYTAVSGGDCADLLGSVYPGSSEVCGNDIDDNCDGRTDEAGCSGCTVFYRDVDGDGFGVTGDSMCLSLADPGTGYRAVVPGDCNDSNEFVFPGAIEKCNGLDDNCDGLTDPAQSASCLVFFFDYDGDGYGVSSDSRCLCLPVGDYTAVDDGDCDDMNPLVGGGAETCNGVDDNCNGRVDEEDAAGCVEYYLDDDGDGVGVTGSSRCLCSAEGRYSTRVFGDCDDTRVSVRPGANDSCNGVDDDCDGLTDPENAAGCQTWYKDSDSDGFGGIATVRCLCGATGLWVTRTGGDCNDNFKYVSPAAVESCNGVDDNCDGQTDPSGVLGCTKYYADRDHDGWGNALDPSCLCTAFAPWTVTVAGDCDDGNALTGPGGAETCNGLDDDCDGSIDEYGAAGCVFYYLDSDRDGYGLAGSEVCTCSSEGIRDAIVGGDCDDSNFSMHPGAAEVCNGVDDDCNGQKDEIGSTGCTAYMIDRDSDGFGVAGETHCLCAPVYPWTSLVAGDCDDSRALTRPGQVESCNGIDDNCDGVSDLENSTGCQNYFKDADADGHGLPYDRRCLCGPAAPYIDQAAKGDCDDTNPEINKGMLEKCDGVDNDCDSQTDETGATGCLTRYLDNDRDGYGAVGQTACGCTVVAPWDATRGGDCNDARADIAPGKVETCNGFDDNCDGVSDPENSVSCRRYYFDEDDDGHGAPGTFRCYCGPTGSFKVTSNDDCDDTKAAMAPGNPEICFNNMDDNCSGEMDEEGGVNCTEYYRDADSDGYGEESTPRCLCGPGIEWKVVRGGDCCDQDKLAYPGATTWRTTATKCNNWDFNCDSYTTKRWETGDGGCSGWGVFSGCELEEGWIGGNPACGVRANFAVGGCGHCGFLGFSCCDPDTESRVQACY